MARAKKVNAPSTEGDQSVGPKFVPDGEKFKVITSSGIEETDIFDVLGDVEGRESDIIPAKKVKKTKKATK